MTTLTTLVAALVAMPAPPTAGPEALTITATMPEAAPAGGTTFEVAIDVALGDGWTASDAGIPKPILQIDAPDGVVPVGAEPADFRAYSRNEFLDTPWERLLDPGVTAIAFRVESEPAADTTIAFNVIAYLVPPGVERPKDAPPADAWFVRRRAEVPLTAGATATATTQATVSTWGPDDRLQIGDMAPDFTLPRADGTTVTLSALRGKNVIVSTYRAFW